MELVSIPVYPLNRTHSPKVTYYLCKESYSCNLLLEKHKRLQRYAITDALADFCFPQVYCTVSRVVATKLKRSLLFDSHVTNHVIKV